VIRYDLRCDKGHAFESWFQASNAYDSQRKRKLIACPRCGSTSIEKAIMAPRLSRGRKADPQESAPPAVAPVETPAVVSDQSTPLLMTQERELRAKLKELRDHVTKNADNVGDKFPDEARKMHYGDIEHRPIYGEATPDEARALIDEGVEVSPLPILPDDRN
jgi:hypothetical protein